MNTLRFKISGDVLRMFPEIHVFGVCVEIDNQALIGQKRREMEQNVEHTRNLISSIEPITQLPEIAQWRNAYSKMDVRPSKFVSSIESLLRRTKKGKLLGTGIPIVDYYNTISIVNRVTLGAYDVKKLSGEDITLRTAKPGIDEFHPLGSESEKFPLNPKLVVYSQGESILCWGINTRDSSLYAVDNHSKDLIFFSETTNMEGRSACKTAITQIQDQMRDVGADVSSVLSFNAEFHSGSI